MVRESPTCRVCMKKTKDATALIEIYNKKSKITYLDCFNVCTQLNALIDDGLPLSLCSGCKDDLKGAFKFLEKARETDKKFKESLGLNRPRTRSGRVKQERDRGTGGKLKKLINEPESEDDADADEAFAEIKTEFISCSKDPLEDSDLENDIEIESKSDDEIEMEWDGDGGNLDSDYDKKEVGFADKDDDSDDDKPLKALIKKTDDPSKLKSQPGTSKEDEEKKDENELNEEDFCKLLEEDAFDSKIDENPPIPTTIENAIFPIGRYMCKICKKTYFTEAGLKFHINVHLPKKRRTKIRSDKGTKRRKGKGKKGAKDADLDSDLSDKEQKDETTIKVPGEQKDDSEEIKNDGEKKDGENETTVAGASTTGEDGEAVAIAVDGGQPPVKERKKRKEKVPKPKKTFPCHVCGRHMISASKLRYHMVMHTGEKDYLCTQCPKAYSTIYALKHHMRTHTGERPYCCKFCGDRFTRPTTLKSHLRRHTGERPYGCDICGKRFIQHSSMTTHMKLNHMAKNIECPHCDKKYARQTDLNTHLLSHTGDKPFSCQLCPSRFIRQANLNKHMNIHHSGAKKSVGSGGNAPSAAAVANAAAGAVAVAAAAAAASSNEAKSSNAVSGSIVTVTVATGNVNHPIGNNISIGGGGPHLVSLGASSAGSTGSNQSNNLHMPPPPQSLNMQLGNNGNNLSVNSMSGSNQTHMGPNSLESVEHLKVIHPQVDNLTNLLGNVIDPERIGSRSVEDIIRWGWPNNS